MKKLSKRFALLLAVAMLLSLGACGVAGDTTSIGGETEQVTTGNETEETTAVDGTLEDDTDGTDSDTETDADTEPDAVTVNTNYKVAMIVDSGDITDQSFNQTTYEACEAFCAQYGIEFQYYKPDSDTDEARVAKVYAAVGDGYNVIVMPGYHFAATIVQESGLYPDVKFVALDVGAGDILEASVGSDYDDVPEHWDVKEYYNYENVFCAVYQEEISGYMAGYAAVKMGYTHLGFLGGMSVPAVVRYGYGFVQGADAAAAELGISDQVTLEYAYGGQFYGDADLTAAMDTWYQSKGVEVVFACGGGIYTSVAEAAAKAGGKIIGVDTDQAAIIDATYGEGLTVTSAIKGLVPVVQTLLSAIILNDDWDSYAGQIMNFGLVSGDDPSLNYVQLPLESTRWNDGFTRDDYDALVSKLYSGAITVSNDAAGMPTTGITVHDCGSMN